MTTPDGDPVMTVKLEPPALPPWWVNRGRLSERLSAASALPLTVVTGRAGSGKSTAVAAWLTRRRRTGRAAWLTLEREDDRPATFWCYVLASLARSGVTVALRRQHDPADTVDRSFLIHLTVSLAAEPEPVVLVLDDVHRLSHPSIFDGLRFVVEHAGSALRLMLIGRDEPPLALHRYRLAGSIAEIRDQELSFTTGEADALLAAHGARLDRAALTAITDRADGWAAALRLQARALSGSAADAEPELAEYVRNELLAEQSAATRQLLIRTCIAADVPAGLAVHLTGRDDAARVLDGLVRTGVFATARTGTERNFVYQPMVRQVLLAELAAGPATDRAELHRQAARWYVRAGRLAEALPHALAGRDWELAATAVVHGSSIADVLAGADSARYAGAFADMPDDLHTAEAALVHAATALARDDAERCAKHLLRAAELTGDSAGARDVHLALSVCAVDVARARRGAGPDDMASASEIAERALEQARRHGIAAPAPLVTLFSLARAERLLWAGDLDGARRALRTRPAGPLDPAEPWAAELLGRLALVEALCGRLRRAAKLARRALAHARGPVETAVGEVTLAWVRMEEYHLVAARGHADRAATLLRAHPQALVAGVLALVRARVNRAHGQLAQAVDALERRPHPGAGPWPPWLAEVLRVARDALLDAGRPPEPGGRTPHHALAEASAALAAGDDRAARDRVTALMRSPRLPLDVRVDCWLIATGAELAGNNPDRARQALQRALRAAKPERLRRPLLEAPARVRRMLREEPALAERHAWFGTAEAAPPTATAPVFEALTAREREVLGHLSQLRSTEEIAQAMFVSVNTVRTHIRGVLRKLAATRRSEAIRRARELGLI
ncbi:LuxR C-terminal-related transcriptional regulator [Actinoplanes sp. NPDC049668]|uniref:LuxR C-terminal-related transcriptional regulator n=1 Tax=unclassified Actinoplanes TaxID=2626549 RepID=UPI0033A78837